jgi:hypothetical protein
LSKELRSKQRGGCGQRIVKRTRGFECARRIGGGGGGFALLGPALDVEGDKGAECGVLDRLDIAKHKSGIHVAFGWSL